MKPQYVGCDPESHHCAWSEKCKSALSREAGAAPHALN